MIQIGNFEYTQTDKGQWIYKSKDSAPVKKEKPKYREQPQFPIQDRIEAGSKNRFGKVIEKTVIEVTKYIKENLS